MISEPGGLDAPTDPARREILRDPHIQQTFWKAGWVTMPMLAEAEVEALTTAIDALQPDDRFDPGDPAWRAVSYHCSFLDTNLDYRRRAFTLVSRLFAPHVARVLLGFRIVQCNIYVKPPGRGEFGLHQNWPATTDLDETTVSIWCPLVDTSPHNGGICVVSGSHKILPHVQAPSTPSYFAGLEAQLWSSGLVESLSLPAGAAVIFDDGLIHGSRTNLSAAPRFAVQLICAPTESTPAYYRDLGDGRFEVVRADVDFWLENHVGDLGAGRADWEVLGVVESRNRPVGFEEFQDLLARGDEIRRTALRLEPARADPAGPRATATRLSPPGLRPPPR